MKKLRSELTEGNFRGDFKFHHWAYMAIMVEETTLFKRPYLSRKLRMSGKTDGHARLKNGSFVLEKKFADSKGGKEEGQRRAKATSESS